MSRFSVIVLVPQDKVPEPGHPDFEDELMTSVVEMLAPFDENEDVAPYHRECDCAGNAVYHKANRLAEEVTGLNWYSLREEWRKKTEDEKAQTTWEAFTNLLTSAETQYREELMSTAKPEATCVECHGTGLYKSTRNTLSKWDYYVIGGRWDGNFKKQNVPTVADNVAFARDVQTAAYAPFAILSPRETHQRQSHGNWSEKGEIGWFATVSNENDNWPAIALELLGKYSSCLAVLVDCHI